MAEPVLGSGGARGRAPRVSSRAAARFALTALLMLVIYGLVYYPYPASSWPARAMHAYLAWLARAAACVIRVADDSVHLRDETVIEGRFPLRIVLDCAALDAQALYLAAVLGFSAPVRTQVIGALAGILFVGAVNLARIVLLYFVGAYAPERFDLIHEQVMLFVIVAATCFAFLLWLAMGRKLGNSRGVRALLGE